MTIDDSSIRVEHHIYDEAKLKEIDIREREKEKRENQIKEEKQLWKEWQKKVVVFLIASILFFNAYMMLGYMILDHVDGAWRGYSYGAVVLYFISFAYSCFLAVQRPKDTLYNPNTVFSNYGKGITLVIIFGIFHLCVAIPGMLMKTLFW